MRARRFFRSLFPRPRTAVGFRQVLPLLIFLVVFAAVCLTLEITGRLLFAQPAAFGLMVFAVWIWWMHLGGFSGLSRARATMALITRLTLLGLFVILLAEPRAVRTKDVVSVIYAIDVSDSIDNERVNEALRFVAETVTEKPQEDKAGVIVFGKNAAVELPPRPSFPLEAGNVINSLIDRDGTDLEQALSLAAAMLPEEDRGKILLMSDGTSTSGTLSQVLDELKSRGVSVDVLPIQYSYDNEVWLERLELPQTVKLGENYEASVVLSSLQAGEGELILRENGKPIAQQHVEFQPGKNRYTFPIYLRDAGYYEYTATIQVAQGRVSGASGSTIAQGNGGTQQGSDEQQTNDSQRAVRESVAYQKLDHLEQNNTVINYIFVEGEGRVLVVTDPAPQADDRDWRPLVQALKEGERAVEVQTAYDFPRDALSLMPYDAIVFVNVAADAFDAIQLDAVKNATRDLGIGFLMVGGPNSFGPGGYHRTAVEETLPVNMDITKKKVLPKGALVIVLHTCEFAEGNTWAKRITKQAIRVLGAQDEVGVMDFEAGGEQWVFELTPAEQYEEMVKKINAAQPGDMPFFEPTMKLGLEGLKKSDASTKHMIIISDGDPQPPTPGLISDFIKNQVSVSTVAIFPHGGQEVGTLRTIAEATKGRYYFPADPNLLPAIFIKEAKTLKRSMIQNKTINPDLRMPSSILKGIDALPPLHGFVLTSVKEERPGVETILVAPAEEDGEFSGDIDPILAAGQFGLGRSAAFTSDLSPNWGADWVNWEQYRAFVTQLMTNISRVKRQGHLRMWTYTSGNEGVVIVEDFHPEEHFLEVQAQIAGPQERAETVRLKQVGPRRYQATVPLWGKGRYQVMAVGVAGEREDRAHGGLIVPYSPEYLRFRANPIVLEEIAQKTGGQVLSGDATAEEIYLKNREPKQSSRPIFDWFLIALACLVPVDVALRRVQLDWYVIKGWLGLGKRAGPSTQTMGALLERKQAVGSQLAARREEKPMATQLDKPPQRRRPERVGAASVASQPTAARAEPGGGGAAQGAPSTTTERLLELKRKRQEKKE